MVTYFVVEININHFIHVILSEIHVMILCMNFFCLDLLVAMCNFQIFSIFCDDLGLKWKNIIKKSVC